PRAGPRQGSRRPRQTRRQLRIQHRSRSWEVAAPRETQLSSASYFAMSRPALGWLPIPRTLTLTGRGERMQASGPVQPGVGQLLMYPQLLAASFNRLVGSRQQRWRDPQPEGLGRPEVDRGQTAGLGTAKDIVHIDRGSARTPGVGDAAMTSALSGTNS